ncbi:MAG: hypothetical protein GXO97_07610 [Nitrospirae bacterium]|nr:hypothetical protein [Nitrospirota bacterium]
MLFRILRFVFFVSICLFPSNVLAVQEHGGAEGLLSHELAHLFFAFSVTYLFVKISLSKEKKKSPYRELRMASLFFIIWNVITFVTHISREYMDKSQFQGLYLRVDNMASILWYTGSIVEHIFIVLACWYFLKALYRIKDVTGEPVDLPVNRKEL